MSVMGIPIAAWRNTAMIYATDNLLYVKIKSPSLVWVDLPKDSRFEWSGFVERISRMVNRLIDRAALYGMPDCAAAWFAYPTAEATVQRYPAFGSRLLN